MGDTISKTISGSDRIALIVFHDPEAAKGAQRSIAIHSQFVDADGQEAQLDQLGLTYGDKDQAMDAFLAAAAKQLGVPVLTRTQLRNAVKSGAYAARAVLREKRKEAQSAQIAARRRELEQQQRDLAAAEKAVADGKQPAA